MIPYAFLVPAFSLIGLMLLYPTVQTIIYSFANDTSTEFVGFSNYTELLGSSRFQNTLFLAQLSA